MVTIASDREGRVPKWGRVFFREGVIEVLNYTPLVAFYSGMSKRFNQNLNDQSPTEVTRESKTLQKVSRGKIRKIKSRGLGVAERQVEQLFLVVLVVYINTVEPDFSQEVL